MTNMKYGDSIPSKTYIHPAMCCRQQKNVPINNQVRAASLPDYVDCENMELCEITFLSETKLIGIVFLLKNFIPPNLNNFTDAVNINLNEQNTHIDLKESFP